MTVPITVRFSQTTSSEITIRHDGSLPGVGADAGAI